MDKVALGPQTLVYPMPAMLVGADVDGKPNFMAVAWGGIACSDPPMISVAIRHARHTLKGIKESQVFSVNVPSVEQVRETDYCGMVSGSKTDKVRACRFDVFYGKLGNAPLIGECPVNLECRVVQMLNLGSHSLVIGRIEETHVSEHCLTDGRPDVDKIKPLTYVTSPAARYQGLGEVVGKAWSVGKRLV
ncbi:MAG: flavin reductase family protein [Methanomicrobiales archaeon]|nr:flavin reductase family protein [Methanomicrobiales archaeon]